MSAVGYKGEARKLMNFGMEKVALRKRDGTWTQSGSYETTFKIGRNLYAVYYRGMWYEGSASAIMELVAKD